MIQLSENDFPQMKETGCLLQRTAGRKLYGKLHSHAFYEIVCGISGEFFHTVNGEKHICTAGSAVFLRPGDSHIITCGEGERPDILTLSFTEQTANEILSSSGNVFRDKLRSGPRFIKITPAETEALRGKTNETGTLYMLTGLFICGVQDAGRAIAGDRITQAINKMNSPENLREGMGALLRLSNYSKAQLTRLMRKCTEQTPAEYIKKLRMREAWRLTDGGASSEAAAEAVGYVSVAHFTEAFKREYGVTPAQVRRGVKTV